MKCLLAGLDPFQAWVRPVACNRIWTKLLSKRVQSLVKMYFWSIFWHMLPVVFSLRKSALKNNLGVCGCGGVCVFSQVMASIASISSPRI